MSFPLFSLDEIREHDDAEGKGFWVIVDSYVLDLTAFLRKHPAGARKIVQRRNKSLDIASNFLDHFGHTVRNFRNACREYDRKGEAVAIQFREVQEPVYLIGKVANTE